MRTIDFLITERDAAEQRGYAQAQGDLAQISAANRDLAAQLERKEVDAAATARLSGQIYRLLEYAIGRDQVLQHSPEGKRLRALTLKLFSRDEAERDEGLVEFRALIDEVYPQLKAYAQGPPGTFSLVEVRPGVWETASQFAPPTPPPYLAPPPDAAEGRYSPRMWAGLTPIQQEANWHRRPGVQPPPDPGAPPSLPQLPDGSGPDWDGTGHRREVRSSPAQDGSEWRSETSAEKLEATFELGPGFLVFAEGLEPEETTEAPAQERRLKRRAGKFRR